MLEQLEKIDREIVFQINSWNTPFFDELMWLISWIPTWIPLYLLLILFVYKKENTKVMLLYILCFALLIGITDQVSSSFFKPFFARYRPSHNLDIPKELGSLHFYEKSPGDFYKGGKYGFVSGHSANSFAIAVFASLVLRKHINRIFLYLLLWASLVAYSRMYLGVHYLSDCIAGAFVGSFIAITVYRLVYKSFHKKLTLSK
ncbi:MAG: phosphatase PAP2 family protein [Lishizhenia sp.]